MKRKFLEDLGLEKEAIDKIMAEHGKSIEKYKDDLAVKETENNTLREQLSLANDEIEGFKKLNIEEIQKAADDYKKKFEEAEKKAKADMEKIQFDHALEKALTDAKAKNAKAVAALLDFETIKLKDGKLVGLKEQLEAIQKDNDYLFDLEDTEGNSGDTKPNFLGGISGNSSKDDGKKVNLMDIMNKASIRKK
jgi:hypothetical protein